MAAKAKTPAAPVAPAAEATPAQPAVAAQLSNAEILAVLRERDRVGSFCHSTGLTTANAGRVAHHASASFIHGFVDGFSASDKKYSEARAARRSAYRASVGLPPV